MQIGTIPLGDGAPLVLISGLNVLESEAAALETADAIREAAGRTGFPLVFKASFDKANRSSHESYRGPGLDEGLRILERVQLGLQHVEARDQHEGRALAERDGSDLHLDSRPLRWPGRACLREPGKPRTAGG